MSNEQTGSKLVGIKKWIKSRWTLLGGLLIIIPILAAALYFQLTKTDPLTVYTQISKNVRDIYNNDDPQKEALVLKQLMDTESAYKTHDFIDRIVIHAANAMAVAGILILLVEYQRMKLSREEHEVHKKELVANVWRGISNLLIPDPICDQLDSLLKYKVVRTNCEYTIIFKPLPTDTRRSSIPEGYNYILLCRALQFDALNISADSIKESMKHTITLLSPGSDAIVKDDGSPLYWHL
jgi:hypothetical protein